MHTRSKPVFQLLLQIFRSLDYTELHFGSHPYASKLKWQNPHGLYEKQKLIWCGNKQAVYDTSPNKGYDYEYGFQALLQQSDYLICFYIVYLNAISPHLTYGRDRNSLHINIHFLNCTESNGLNCYIGKLLCLHIQLKLFLSKFWKNE